MNGYYGYGYAHPYYYPSVGAWPWGYVGQAPPGPPPRPVPPTPRPALDPNFPVSSAFDQAFYDGYGRMPTPMEKIDYALSWTLDGYGELLGRQGYDLQQAKKQIGSHVRRMLSRSGL